MTSPVFLRTLLLAMAVLGVTSCAPVIRHHAVTDISTYSSHPRIVAVGGASGTVYVIWNEAGAVAFAKARMGTSLSSPSTPMSVDFSSTAPEPSLAAWRNRVFIAVSGLQSSPGGSTIKDVFFTVSNDLGNSFSSTLNISNMNNETGRVGVAASGDNVSVAWVHRTRGPDVSQDAVYVASSTDGGQSFSTPINLSGPTAVSANFRIGAYQNNVYVLWCKPRALDTGGDDIFLRTSRDGGVSFGSPTTISSNLARCGNEELLLQQDKVYVLFAGIGTSSNTALFVRVSLDAGATFSTARNVSISAERSVRGKLTAVGNNMYVTWEQDVLTTSGKSTDVFFSRSADNGVNFSPPVNLSQGNFDEESWKPAIAASGQYVHVIWMDAGTEQMDAGTGQFDIFYRRSNDSGVSFQPFQTLPPGPSNPLDEGDQVIVARNGKDIYVAWIRQRPATVESELYYYSKRACPRMPAESGLFRCLNCCS